MAKPNGLWFLDPDPKPRGRVFKRKIGWLSTVSVWREDIGMRSTIEPGHVVKAFDTLPEAYAHAVEQAGRG